MTGRSAVAVGGGLAVALVLLVALAVAAGLAGRLRITRMLVVALLGLLAAETIAGAIAVELVARGLVIRPAPPG